MFNKILVTKKQQARFGLWSQFACPYSIRVLLYLNSIHVLDFSLYSYFRLIIFLLCTQFIYHDIFFSPSYCFFRVPWFSSLYFHFSIFLDFLAMASCSLVLTLPVTSCLIFLYLFVLESMTQNDDTPHPLLFSLRQISWQ